VRVVVAPEAFGDGLDSRAAAAAIADGWRRSAPADELVPDLPGDLVVTGLAVLDWRALRDSPLTALAARAARAGVPCVVLAGSVLAGRRELGAIGVDAAHAVDGPVDAVSLAALAARTAARWSR
jgi:glycerate kinase